MSIYTQTIHLSLSKVKQCRYTGVVAQTSLRHIKYISDVVWFITSIFQPFKRHLLHKLRSYLPLCGSCRVSLLSFNLQMLLARVICLCAFEDMQ